MFQRYILCCCRQKWYRNYENAISKVEFDLLRRYDFIKFSKRMRQHSAALSLIGLKEERKLAASMSFDRPLEYIEEYSEDVWYENEFLSKKDKNKIAIYKRFLKIMKKEAA
jgi:hypothetical protein